MNTKNLLSNVAKEMGKSDVAAAKMICKQYYEAAGNPDVISDGKLSNDELIRIATNILNDEIKIHKGGYTINKVELDDIAKYTPIKPEPYLPELKKFLDKFC